MKVIKPYKKIFGDPRCCPHAESSLWLQVDILQQTHSQRLVQKTLMRTTRDVDLESIACPFHTISAIMCQTAFCQVTEHLRLSVLNGTVGAHFENLVSIGSRNQLASSPSFVR